MSSEPFCNIIVRRMVNLPRSLMGGFSRLIGRRNFHQPLNFHLQFPQHPLIVQEEWAFVASFEQQYGSTHPFFYACRFTDTLKIAEEEGKFMFMYLHSPDHPFTLSFCRDTLCSELVVQFLDANFVCWGALADRGEGLKMAATLHPASFPFCAVVSPANDHSLAVLQQMEGPISPAELVEILQQTVEEKGEAFGKANAKNEEKMRARAKEEEKIRADRQLREEQDAAYLAALQIDKERERLQNLPTESSNRTNMKKINRPNPPQRLFGKAKQPSIVKQNALQTENPAKDATKILIRFPNGETREQSFSCSDKIQSIYRYIDSLGLPGIGNYRLISSFPRRSIGVDQMGMTLKDAGLHSRASLFLEPM